MIKYVILAFSLLIIAFHQAQACKLSIPDRDLSRFLNPPVSGHYLKCEDFPEDKCHCVENIDPWSADTVDDMVIDFIRKDFAVSCIDEADCLAKESAQVCQFGRVIRTESEVYCAVKALKKDGVKLVEVESKREAKRQEQQAQRLAEKAKEDKRKAFKFKGKTIAELRDELNEFLDTQK